MPIQKILSIIIGLLFLIGAIFLNYSLHEFIYSGFIGVIGMILVLQGLEEK